MSKRFLYFFISLLSLTGFALPAKSEAVSMLYAPQNMSYALPLYRYELINLKTYLDEAVPSDEQNVQTVQSSIYDRPYSWDENDINSAQLKRNTLTLGGVSIGVLGLLYLAPSSFTNWEDDDKKNPFRKWWDNVSREPVWDKDDWFLNYVTHPYSGAVYYMGARSAGANPYYSFMYSFMLSTFWWEYGIESFAERPSIQDLIVTPIAGSIVGEGFYLLKRHIVENNYCLNDSPALGKTVALIIDPFTEISDYIWKDDGPKNFSLRSSPTLSRHGHMGYSISFSYSF
ncbi:MAG: DUF3943 domain-containing protein [Lactobacillales bacterium]|jgi:hypothetical protein|nr:DUF3943 domain-containing protein [Lactobacillales bacterium]